MAGLGAAACGGWAVTRGGRVAAASVIEAVDVAAGAAAPAERIRLSRLLTFPVLPGAGVIVLDNFGGFSVSSGSCSHRGIDIFPTGDDGITTPRVLVACVDGVIEGQRLLAGSQGNAWILHDDAGVAYRYHHVGEFAPGLEVGSPVRRGDVLGTMGSTGNADSPHLHFEVRLDGATSASAVDPLPLLTVPDENTTIGPPAGCPT